jgi:hypothetical protein
LARRGALDRAFPSILAKFAEKQTRDHRITGGHLNVKDILSKYCQLNKDVVVERLDRFNDEDGCWEEAVVVDTRNAPVPEIVAFRVDFKDWLRSLPGRDRKIAKYLSLGHRTSAAATKFGVTAGRISQLRKELAENWRRFVGDEPGPAAVAA